MKFTAIIIQALAATADATADAVPAPVSTGCHNYPNWNSAVAECVCPVDAASAGTMTQCHGASAAVVPIAPAAVPGCVCPADAASAETMTHCHGASAAAAAAAPVSTGCHGYPNWNSTVVGCVCPVDAASAGTMTQCHGAATQTAPPVPAPPALDADADYGSYDDEAPADDGTRRTLSTGCHNYPNWNSAVVGCVCPVDAASAENMGQCHGASLPGAPSAAAGTACHNYPNWGTAAVPANPPPSEFKSCGSFTGTCPDGKHRAREYHMCKDKDGQTPDACTADHCCQIQCSSWTGTCPADSKKKDENRCGSESSSCDATKCCEYNCKTSFVGTCAGNKEVIDKETRPDEDGKISNIPAADYWKWNGEELIFNVPSNSESCCQNTCKSSGRTCKAGKDGKEMALKDGGKESCDGDECREEKFDDHCCEEKTCIQDKCTPNGDFDDVCGKNAGCAACAFDEEPTKDGLDKCAACATVNKEWCGGCLQCMAGVHVPDLGWKVKVKDEVKDKVKDKDEASKPKLPTFAPTPKPTNPKKPEFDAKAKAAHEKKLKSFKVATKIDDKTRAPTKAPTKPPTYEGYKIVKKKQKRKAATATMGFSMTEKEANNPVMQEALTTGVAQSVGKDPADVKINSINGKAIVRRRRLTDVKIEFEIMSNSDDADAADQLKADLETAATEGSIVAKVQEAANERGVLVKSLQEMALVMEKPTVEVADVEVEVEVQERVEEEESPPVDTLFSGATNTKLSSSFLTVAIAIASVTALAL